MKIKMKINKVGAVDESGIRSRYCKAGEILNSPQDISLATAKVFVKEDYAERLEDDIVEMTPTEVLKKQQEELRKANGKPQIEEDEEDIIDIDDDEDEEEEKEEGKKIPEKPLFNKYNNNKKKHKR